MLKYVSNLQKEIVMKKILGILGLVACLTLGTVGCNSNEDKKMMENKKNK